MGRPRGSKVEIFNGFIKQVPRAMFYLLKGAHSVKIESEDDVSVLNINGTVEIVEQLKTSESKNVFANNSNDFWETIYNWVLNWIEFPENCKFTKNTKFIIYSANKNSIIGNCLQRLLTVDGFKDFENALNFCESKISKKNETIQEYFHKIKENKEIAYNIIKNLIIEQPEESISQDLDKLVEKKYQKVWGAETFDCFVQKLNGWYSKKILGREGSELKKCEITSLELEAFKANFSKFEKKVRYITGNLTAEEKQKLETNLFVEQLRVVEIPDEIIYIAKKDYIGWTTFKDNDLIEGISTQEILNDTYLNLKNRWHENKDEIFSTHKDLTEIEKGKKLYHTSLKEPLFINGVDLIGDIKGASRGVHNFLADQDLDSDYSIGWHPKYSNIFKGEGQRVE